MGHRAGKLNSRNGEKEIMNRQESSGWSDSGQGRCTREGCRSDTNRYDDRYHCPDCGNRRRGGYLQNSFSCRCTYRRKWSFFPRLDRGGSGFADRSSLLCRAGHNLPSRGRRLLLSLPCVRKKGGIPVCMGTHDHHPARLDSDAGLYLRGLHGPAVAGRPVHLVLVCGSFNRLADVAECPGNAERNPDPESADRSEGGSAFCPSSLPGSCGRPLLYHLSLQVRPRKQLSAWP